MDQDRIIQKIYSKIDEIPTLSPLLQKIMSLVESSKSNAHDVTEVISRDPALTSKVLKVANSAYYGFSGSIDNLDHSIVLLGFNMVKSLSLSIGLIKTLPSSKASGQFSQDRLWLHSLAVATIMKEIGIRKGRVEASETLFVTGLLHDIGKIVLDQFFGEQYNETVIEAGGMGSSNLCKAECNHFGMDHGEIGNILLTRWKFPETICNPIAAHHKEEIPEGTNTMDLSTLRVANVLSQEAGMAVSKSADVPAQNEADLELLKISGEELDELRSFLQDAKDGILEFFNAVT